MHSRIIGATIVVAYGPAGALELTVPFAAFLGALLGVGLA